MNFKAEGCFGTGSALKLSVQVSVSQYSCVNLANRLQFLCETRLMQLCLKEILRVILEHKQSIFVHCIIKLFSVEELSNS